MRKITFNVTRRDLDSKCKSKNICEKCPVARAIRRHKEFKDASVNHSTVNYPKLKFMLAFELPLEVRQFIQSYGSSTADRSSCKPFKFTIEVA